MYSACMINVQARTSFGDVLDPDNHEDPVVDAVYKWADHMRFYYQLKEKIQLKRIVLLDHNKQLIDLTSAELIYDDDVIMVGT